MKSDALVQIRAVIRSLTAIEDPIARAKAVSQILDEMPHLQTELRIVRQEAVNELRASGQSNGAIAAELNISVPRVSQISRGVARSSKRSRSSS